jgi:hypothetical protein
LTGKIQVLEEKLPQCHFHRRESHIRYSRNPVPRGQMLTSNHLSVGSLVVGRNVIIIFFVYDEPFIGTVDVV